MTSKRIGVFGGTFDPPHVGHLVAAVNVAAQLELSEVLFVVANIPWQKMGTRAISAAPERLAMVELAVRDRNQLVASDVEIRRGGDSVTADTLDELAVGCPDHEPIVIVGSDSAPGMATWRRPEELMRLARVAVIDRPGSSGAIPPDGFDYEVVPCPLMDVSSQDIRDRVRDGLPIDYLVPDAVRDYIDTQALYQ
ncbi:MAG: nicotinate-nucleotide adenylyltransferase [Acidimicrobiales bacterium]